MKAALRTLLGLAVVLAVVVVVNAEEGKGGSKTLKGTLGCGKCVFKISKDIHKGKCINVIKVKEGDKEVVYILDDQGHLRTHVAVFIDGHRAQDRRGLTDALTAQSKVYVLQALSGG